MLPDSWSWHWGPFFIYCAVCFFTAFVLGMLGVPGILVIAVGVVVGIWAAARHWFEVPLVPRPDR